MQDLRASSALLAPHVESKLAALGVAALEPRRRVAEAMVNADQSPSSSLQAVLERELWEAHALQDTRVFVGLLSAARALLQCAPAACTLSADSMLQFMKHFNRDASAARCILQYATEAGAHLVDSGEHGEKLFAEFFRACEVEGNMPLAESAFQEMVRLNLPVKQITLGRLIAVCFEAADGEAARRVHEALNRYGIAFSHHILTKYVGTFLRVGDTQAASQVLGYCEDPNSGMSGKLDRESYRRLREIHTTPECQEVLRRHMESMGLISGCAGGAAPSRMDGHGAPPAPLRPAPPHAACAWGACPVMPPGC